MHKNCCCRWPCLSPLFFQQVLLMPWDRPIAFAVAAVDGLAWAHWFFSRCCRCPRTGPLHLQLLLPMASLGPIIFFESCCQCLRMGPLFMQLLLLMDSLGPIIFSAGFTNALGWAHCICSCSC